jgi:hypothetical protein
MLSEITTGTPAASNQPFTARLSGQIANHEIPAAVVLQVPGSGHLGRDIDHRRHHGLRDACLDALGVVDAVLQVDDDRVCSEVRRDLRGGLLGVGGFHAEEHEPGALHRRRLGARLDADQLVELLPLEMQARGAERIHVLRAADQRDAMPAAREHAAEKAADRARAEHRRVDFLHPSHPFSLPAEPIETSASPERIM